MRIPTQFYVPECRENGKRAAMPQLRPGLDAVAWCMSRYIHPSKPICEKYMNRPKGQNIEDFILVGEINRSLQRKGVVAPVYYLFCDNFPDVEFFASRHCVHVKEEGPDKSLVGPLEALVFQRGGMRPIYGAEVDN